MWNIAGLIIKWLGLVLVWSKLPVLILWSWPGQCWGKGYPRQFIIIFFFSFRSMLLGAGVAQTLQENDNSWRYRLSALLQSWKPITNRRVNSLLWWANLHVNRTERCLPTFLTALIHPVYLHMGSIGPKTARLLLGTLLITPVCRRVRGTFCRTLLEAVLLLPRVDGLQGSMRTNLGLFHLLVWLVQRMQRPRQCRYLYPWIPRD